MKITVWFISLLFMTSILLGYEDTILTKYTEAEHAATAADREKLYNQALEAYLQIDAPSYLLSYNIGNCYYHLNEYGLAILYYWRSLAQNPRYDKAYINLQAAASKIGLNVQDARPYLLMTPSEIQLSYLGFILFSFIFFTLYFYLSQRFFYYLAVVCCFLSISLLATIVWDHYIRPLDAVVIEPSPLRQDAGTQYGIIPTKQPIFGERVQVLEFHQDNPWIKIKTPYGEVGYVSKEQARII